MPIVGVTSMAAEEVPIFISRRLYLGLSCHMLYIMLRYYIKDYIFGIVFLSFICARMLVVRYMQYFFRGIEMSALLRHIYHIHNFFFGPMACQLVIRRWANADLLSLFSEGADCSSV